MFEHIKSKGLKYWSSERKIQISETHWHDFYEVELIIDGKATEFINGNPYKTQKGTLTIIPPGAFHGYSISGDFLKLRTFCFSETLLSSEIKRKFDKLNSPLLFELNSFQINELQHNLDKIESIIETSQFQYDIVRRITEIYLIMLCEKCKNLYNKDKLNNRQIELVCVVIEYIEEHFSEQISRDKLADALNYSPAYFSSIFKKISGVSLSEHIKAVRMRKAMDLMLNSDLPISTIIKDIGYNSPSLFYKTFHSHFNINPKDVRAFNEK